MQVLPSVPCLCDAHIVSQRSGLDGETGRSKRKRVRNSGRAACFRRFLLDTFGVDLLRSGSGVLDVSFNGVPVICSVTECV